MAKQDEQKQKGGQSDRPGWSVARVPARFSAAIVKAAVKIRALPEEDEADMEGLEPTDKLERIPGAIRRRQLLIGGAGLAATTLALGGSFWLLAPHPRKVSSHPVITLTSGDQLVVFWNTALLDILHRQQTPLPMAARALSIVHTSMFDAWAAYDAVAVGTRLGAAIRQSDSERTLRNKCQTISYAAYHALADLFPGEQEHLRHLMNNLKYNPSDFRRDTSTPAGIGNLTAQAVLDFRHNDGSNQLGNLLAGAYADYTHYRPLNTPDEIQHPNSWQPLSVPVGGGSTKAQQFVGAHWADVLPFAIPGPLQFVPRPGPPQYPDIQYTNQAAQIIEYSAGLTQEQKAIAEYWMMVPDVQILARWFAFAHVVSARDNHTLDQNVKLFFALANAALDTSIACWACKRAYNSPYPITVIRYLFKDKQIRAWAGAGKGLQWFNGQYWFPYQPLNALSPAYPEYCSEQSAFSAAAAEILRDFTGKNELGTSSTWSARNSSIEPIQLASTSTLTWPTLSDAANQAGMAGRYSGTHFSQSDLDGRTLGSQVASQVWRKALGYINGQPG